MFSFSRSTKLILLVLVSILVFNLSDSFKSVYADAMMPVSMTNNLRAEVDRLIQRQAKAWQQGQVDQIVADFAEDAIFIVPGSTFKGKAAIAEAAQKYFDQYHQTKIEIERIIYEHPQGAVQWTWQDVERQTGKVSYAKDAIIFELKDSLIVYWREYIEPQTSED